MSTHRDKERPRVPFEDPEEAVVRDPSPVPVDIETDGRALFGT